MSSLQIPHERLFRQRIAGEGLKSPADVVRWMGAVQAQDYAAAKWAIGLRTASCADADLEAAFTAGDIIRTHVMRPTWHFIAPEDIKWMQALTARRVRASIGYYTHRLELDATQVKHINAVLIKTLRDGRQLTRTELGSALRAAGLQASGLQIGLVLMHAELNALICSGGRRGKQLTWALVAERAPRQRKLDREESLALLSERYFTSHGPATLRDYAWWSGLAVADVRRGLEMVKSRLVSEELEGQTYWMTASAPEPRFTRRAVHLLPNYDEYIVGYTDRTMIFDESHAKHLDARQNPLFNHTVVSNGHIVGTWKRLLGKNTLGIEARLFAEPRKAEVRALGLAARRLSEFLALPISGLRF